MKHIRKILTFCFMAVTVLALGIIFMPKISVFAEASVTSQAYTTYQDACMEMKNVETYSSDKKTEIVAMLENYSSAKQNYLVEEGATLDNDAEQKYFILNYGYASDEILNIKYYSDNKILAEKTMLRYKNAWSDLKQNNLSSYENLDANAKYYSLYAEKDSLKTICNEPEPSNITYVYNGQLQEFQFNAMFDNKTMIVTGNKQTDAGEYEVVVSFKDRNHYEWKNAGHSGDLTFKWTIEKGSLENKILSFDDQTFVEDGTEKNLEAEVSTTSIKVAYSDNNSQSAPGVYRVKATFYDLSNNYEPVIRYATMTIKPATFVQKNEVSKVDQVIVEQAGGFDPMMSLEVTTIASDGIKYGDVSYSKHILSTEEVALAYEIDLVREGVSVEPESELTVKMYIPETVQGKKFRILHTHYSPSQVVKEIDYVLSGNYAVISTNELSQFAFVVEKEDANKPLSAWAFTGIVIAITFGVLFLIYLAMFIIWKFSGKSISFFEKSFRRFSKFITGTQYNRIELAEQEKQLANIS